MSTVGPFHHDVEYHLTEVLAPVPGGLHARHDSAGPGTAADQLDLVVGRDALADQHPVEFGTGGDDVISGGKAFGRLSRVDFDVAGVAPQKRRSGPDNEKCDENKHDQTRHGTSVSLSGGYRTQLLPRCRFYHVSMSTEAAIAVTHPRRAVIDRAWRAIGPGVEMLSGDDGGPLRRTVKRIIDPLVLRLRSNSQFSAPFVAEDVAAAMHDAIVGRAAELRAAAAWFDVLKRERRRLRITTGNAQELYFPVCFELAVTKGGPAENDSAEAILRDIHGDRDRTAIQALNQYVDNDIVVEQLSAQLRSSWGDVRVGKEITGPFLAGLTTVLGSAVGHNSSIARQRVWEALTADAAPYNLGAAAREDVKQLPWSIVALGLSVEEPQQPPDVVESASDRPLDRSVVDRVRATLRRAMDREELPEIPMLCEEEVDRSCAPWGLLAEDKQATLVAGIEVAVDLAPLSESAVPRYDLSRQIQARLRKEAYVLHARRYLADDGPMHPRQQQVVDDLANFARPYASRLWARLHGRDVWQEPCADVDDVRALLEGVARSVSLDHRQRIKTMLELQVAG